MVRRKKRPGSVIHKKYRYHAHKRLRKRYDTNISVKNLVRCIRQYVDTDEFKIIKKKKSTCSRDEMLVEYQGNKYRLIYSRSTKQIVTFLPLEEEE